jgi:FAD synthetase
LILWAEEALTVAPRRDRTLLTMVLVFRSFEELAISYNGGKDCLVLLVLYLAAIHAYATHQNFSPPNQTSASITKATTNGARRIQLPPTLPAIYILTTNPFPSVTNFVTTSAAHYALNLKSYPSPMLSAFTSHLETNPNIRAIFVGTRRTDPHGAKLTPFAPTDGNWPSFMRIHPVLDWNYVDVWCFIRGVGVEYCDLYDQGYTSLGGRGDTWPNPKLRIDSTEARNGVLQNGHGEAGGQIATAKNGDGVDGAECEEGARYRPAYELVEDDEERLGREKR